LQTVFARSRIKNKSEYKEGKFVISKIKFKWFDVMYLIIGVENLLYYSFQTSNQPGGFWQDQQRILPDLLIGLSFFSTGIVSIILSLWNNPLSAAISLFLSIIVSIMCLFFQLCTFAGATSDIIGNALGFFIVMHDSWLSMICCYVKSRRLLKEN